MTSNQILQFLVGNKYDFPTLQTEAVEKIATDFANIVYESLKLKSTSGSSKRLDILTFLKQNQSHSHYSITEANYRILLENLHQSLYAETDEITEFTKKVHSNLEKDVCKSDIDFFIRKRRYYEEKTKKLDNIQKWDQNLLDKTGFLWKISTKLVYEENYEQIVQSLFNLKQHEHDCPKDSIEYRRKEIQFGYALIYLKKWKMLYQISKRIIRHTNIEEFEMIFLIYLSEHCECLKTKSFLYDNCFFIFEKIIIDICTELIEGKRSFDEITTCKKFETIREIAKNGFNLKIKNIIIQLYVYSFCNVALLELSNCFS